MMIKPDFFAKGYEYTAGIVHQKTQEEIDVLDSYGGEMIFTPGDIIYSSSALIEMAAPSIGIEKLMILMRGEDISFNQLRESLKTLNGIKVHVVGDTIVDSYTYCSMIGGMTKTPTMSVRLEKKVNYTGGAAVVAKHLSAAGAEVTFSTVLGDDELKDFVLNDLSINGVEVLPIIDETRPTTNKNAIVAESYRLLKIDTLDNRSISEKILEKLKANIQKVATKAVVFSDFRHGIFNKETIPQLTSMIQSSAFKVADSQVASRWGNILEFKNFDLITPNEREARFALGDQDSVVRPLALDLYKKSGCKTLILKCGAKGIIVYRSKQDYNYRAFFVVESFADKVVDAVGAGDALLAYSTLAMIATKNEVIASILGSIAAGIECEHEGNWLVTPIQVLHKINSIEKLVNYDGVEGL
jgi:rfaE bifunctional protein kinase chain/domain